MRSYPSSARLLGGALRLIHGEPCLLIEADKDKTLVASDLHIGFEKRLAEKGINIPSQTPKLLAKMKRIIRQHRPSKIILLGDVKHGTSKILLHEWADIPQFFEGLLQLVDKVEVVPGNHDGGLKPLLPRSITLHPPQGTALEASGKRVALAHGHAWPLPEAFSSDCLILGHHHFTFEFRDTSGLRMVEPVWFKAEWDAGVAAESYLKAKQLGRREGLEGPKNGARVLLIVLPAFNPLLGGFPVTATPVEEYHGPVFTSGGVKLRDAEIFLLDGTFLGTLSQLRKEKQGEA